MQENTPREGRLWKESPRHEGRGRIVGHTKEEETTRANEPQHKRDINLLLFLTRARSCSYLCSAWFLARTSPKLKHSGPPPSHLHLATPLWWLQCLARYDRKNEAYHTTTWTPCRPIMIQLPSHGSVSCRAFGCRILWPSPIARTPSRLASLLCVE